MTPYEEITVQFYRNALGEARLEASRLRDENRALRNAVPMQRYFRSGQMIRVPALRVLRVKAVA